MLFRNVDETDLFSYMVVTAHPRARSVVMSLIKFRAWTLYDELTMLLPSASVPFGTTASTMVNAFQSVLNDAGGVGGEEQDSMVSAKQSVSASLHPRSLMKTPKYLGLNLRSISVPRIS